MNFVAASKTVAQLDENLTTSQTHSLVLDTLGVDHASIDVCFEKVAAAGTASAVALTLKVQQGDGTTYTDIAALVGGGVGGFTIPTPPNATSDNVVRFDIDTRAQQGRFLRVLATGNAAGSIYSVARLSKTEQSPWDAASKGVLRTVATSLGVNPLSGISYVS